VNGQVPACLYSSKHSSTILAASCLGVLLSSAACSADHFSVLRCEGDRLKEGIKINLSLTALGNVISALVDGKSGHIPYR